MGLVTPWTATTSFLTFFSSSLYLPKVQSYPLSNPYRLICRCQSVSNDLQFVLHDALDACGVDTTNARAAREDFCSQIGRFTTLERQTSICNRGVDLGIIAFQIAAEDHSLLSQSNVPFPVDTFVDRLDDLSMGYFPHHKFSASPKDFIGNLESYLYVHKGFQRKNVTDQSGPQTLYLHYALANRSGSALMLSLIYSEVLKMLHLWGLFNFDVEIDFPHDLTTLPRGYDKKNSEMADQPHIMTSQSLLVEILRTQKEAFWPFQFGNTKSLFLRAADAAHCIDGPSLNMERKFEIESTEASSDRLRHGVWNRSNGNMRCALSACERLILLASNSDELRDYGILLYHCGFYKESLQYLNSYQVSKNHSLQNGSSNPFSNQEEDAVNNLMFRLNLV
ncbi:uncharacterized protein LOC122088431 isoform X2 [Macadamia integrifolia]|uniref:uncharacterized protein LOC122088431 isoform X2 n=1 Tax=Macadamia integrifolia TaxID=60698 RepID=UPI001C4EE9E8|nr:uncharacterized protein LOC122088431 isoform X2 [Macadamia integrifolia]